MHNWRGALRAGAKRQIYVTFMLQFYDNYVTIKLQFYYNPVIICLGPNIVAHSLPVVKTQFIDKLHKFDAPDLCKM
jgi:hypothetical protein